MFVWRNNSSAWFFLLPRFLGKFYIILLSLPALNVHLGKYCVVLDAKQSSNHWLHKHDHCVSPNQLFLYSHILIFFFFLEHIRGTTSKFCLINEPWNCLVLFSLIHFDTCRSFKTQPAKTNGRCSVDGLSPGLPSQVCFCWIDSHPRLLVWTADQIPSLQSHEGLDWDPHLRSALRISGKQHHCRHLWGLSAKHDGGVRHKKVCRLQKQHSEY